MEITFSIDSDIRREIRLTENFSHTSTNDAFKLSGGDPDEEDKFETFFVSASDVQGILDIINTERIPVIRSEGLMGLDGKSYKLSFRSCANQSTFSWWMTVGGEWSPLGEIASRLEHLWGRNSGHRYDF